MIDVLQWRGDSGSRLVVVIIKCRVFFFFQAEDGIRDRTVTGVQTCALPISPTARAGTRSLPLSPTIVAAVRSRSRSADARSSSPGAGLRHSHVARYGGTPSVG